MLPIGLIALHGPVRPNDRRRGPRPFTRCVHRGEVTRIFCGATQHRLLVKRVRRISEGCGPVAARFRDVRVGMQHQLRATSGGPPYRFRIAPTLVTDHDAKGERQKANEYYQKALKIWDQGRNPNKVFWIDGHGVKYKMSNVQAAIGLGQLERCDELIRMKRRVFSWYETGLKNQPWVHLNREVDGAHSIYWMTSLRLDEAAPVTRDEFCSELKNRNIDTRPVFPAISQYPIWGRSVPAQPVAQRLGLQALNLPSGVGLSKEEVDYICRQIRDILK